MTALLLVAVALLVLPFYVVALAVVRLLDRTDATVHVRPASDAATSSPTTSSSRAHEDARVAARQDHRHASPGGHLGRR